MAGAAGRRNPVPSTRTLEDQMDSASDKLQDLLTAEIGDIFLINELQDLSRSLRAAWEEYANILTSITLMQESSGQVQAQRESRETLLAKRVLYKTKQESIRRARSELLDDNITVSDSISIDHTQESLSSRLASIEEIPSQEKAEIYLSTQNLQQSSPIPQEHEPESARFIPISHPLPNQFINTVPLQTTSVNSKPTTVTSAVPSQTVNSTASLPQSIYQSTFTPYTAPFPYKYPASQHLHQPQHSVNLHYMNTNPVPAYKWSPLQPQQGLNPSAAPYQPLHQPSATFAEIKNDNPFLSTKRNTSNSSDASMQFLLRREMSSTKAPPFDGDASRFHGWAKRIQRTLESVPMEPEMVVDYLISQTTGEPKLVITNFQDALPDDPVMVLDRVWKELNKSYGSSEKIARNLEGKISKFPPLKSTGDMKAGMKSLIRLCLLLESHLNNPELMHFNNHTGLKLLYDKLDHKGKEVLSREMAKHKRINKSFHLKDFVAFLDRRLEDLETWTDISSTTSVTISNKATAKVLATHASSSEEDYKGNVAEEFTCVLHKSKSHVSAQCYGIAKLSKKDKETLIKDNKLCFRCLGKHFKGNCTEQNLHCKICQGNHVTALHRDTTVKFAAKEQRNFTPPEDRAHSRFDVNSETNLHTSFMLPEAKFRDCSKVLLVDVWPTGAQHRKVRCYALIDEQSSTTFVAPELAQQLEVSGPQHEYNLRTMSGFKSLVKGEKISGLIIKGVGENKSFSLPVALTHSSIPNCKHEVATPEFVASLNHVNHLAKNFSPLDTTANVMLLIGRNGGQLMATKCYGSKPPYAHHTSLGWALVGYSCSKSKPNCSTEAVTLRTSMDHEHFDANSAFPAYQMKGVLPANNTFARFPDDEEPGMSHDDRKFLEILNDGIKVDEDGYLEMPLPFKSSEPSFPDNHYAVYQRTHSTLMRLKSEPAKLQQCLDTMGKYIAFKQVEPVPDCELIPSPGKAWWLPVFPVVHPKKLKCRLVFDSSAEYKGTSLNKQLLQGPDHNNALKGVLTRFRNGPIAVVADIESMFHSFHLPKDDRDFVRFYWFKENDPDKQLTQMRARVHIFGNTGSPSVANFGLQYAAKLPASNHFPEGQDLILHRLYVDDGLACADSVATAVAIVKGARKILSKFNIRLHKIASNSKDVLEAFPTSECAVDSALELRDQPAQHALGLKWIIDADVLTFNINVPNRPFTKRGIVSIVNSLFDPLGIAAPITLTGRILQRRIIGEVNEAVGWDDPLPTTLKQQWDDWKSTLKEVSQIRVPRSYYAAELVPIKKQELHTFADASIESVGYAIYLRSIGQDDKVCVSLVVGGSKLAPKATTSVPRLELCAALEAASAATEIQRQLKVSTDNSFFYSDSRITLGYLQNSSRRFSKYVSRRVELILNCTQDSNWYYINTQENPADLATRPQTPASLRETLWLTGPSFLWNKNMKVIADDLIVPAEQLPEFDHKVMKVDTARQQNTSQDAEHVINRIIERSSSWSRLLRVCRAVISVTNWLDRAMQHKRGRILAPRPPFSDVSNRKAKIVVLKQAQVGLQNNVINKLRELDPYEDEDGLIRVGGRLKHAFLPLDGRNPIVLPVNSKVGGLLAAHAHECVRHQGRSITLGRLRANGYHLCSARKTIDNIISNCSTCRRLRGTPLTPKMANLPPDRLEYSPPFTNVGVDICGPFLVTDGQHTRRTSATKKAYGALFTCLVTRGVHIELLPSLDTNAMVNALRRFLCIRGICKRIRSDNGSNLMACRAQLMNQDHLKSEASKFDCTWTTSPPGASHFNGVIERKIGQVRRILEACLLDVGNRAITRDELSTFFQEAASIINNAPLIETSSFGDDPQPITPANLLTLKDSPNPPTLAEVSQADLDSYGTKRWKRIQHISEQFWQRFRKYYIMTLQQRHKWQHKKEDLHKGDVVLIADKGSPRNSWPLARVIESEPSRDSTRSYLVETSDSQSPGKKRHLRRAAVNLVLLQRGGGRSVTAP